MTLSIPQTKPASSEALAALSRRYGELPPEYVRFLRNHDGAALPDHVLDGTEDVYVAQFVPAAKIPAVADGIEGFPKYLIPFGHDDCGNYLCIGANDHKVYFWDHDFEDGCSVAANTFAEFLDRLVVQIFDEEEIMREASKAEYVWVDPEFKAAYRSYFKDK